MVFKRGVALLALAATAAVVAAEPIQVHSHLKNPVVKAVHEDHGKLTLTLQEGTTIHKKHAAKHGKTHAVKKVEAKKTKVVKVAKQAHPVKAKVVKVAKQAHPLKHEVAHAKKPAHKTHQKVTEEKKDNGEIVRKYKHGEVRIMSKNQPKTDAHHKGHAAKKEAKKHAKQVHEEPTAAPADDDSVEETNVDLTVGQSVYLEFAGHQVELELNQNGTVTLYTDGQTYLLPKADSIDIDVTGTDEEGSLPGSGSAAAGSVATVGDDAGVIPAIEGEASKLAKKFTELATKMTGNGKYVSRDAAPFVFGAGVIGALAAVVGIAAIALGRSRDAAAADPQSVLADATEDVEADIEAATAEATSEDAAAEDSQSLASSDSESDADEDQEEGKFTNEVASV